MMAPLIIFLVTLNPWVGVWRVQLVDSARQPTHIFVRHDLSIELYEPNWSYLELVRSEFVNDQLHLVTRTETGAQNVHLKVKLVNGRRLEGMVEMWLGGGALRANHPVMGIKVLPFAPPRPPDWIAASRQWDGSRIDVLGLVLREAPRSSFEEFARFWEQKIERHYYIYLHEDLYGPKNDHELRRARLKALFGRLASYQADQLPALEEAVIGALSGRLRALAGRADCRVVLPDLVGEQPRAERIAVTKLDYLDGTCSCFKNFKAELFLLLPLAPGLPESP
ncbi:MAG: hypothetical protein V3T83_15325 [Acidobacteriota bacterium]